MTAPGHTHRVESPASTTLTLPVIVTGRVSTLRFFQAHPVLRRVTYVIGYEGLSVLFTVFVMSALLGHGGGESTLLAVMLSTAATIWNYVWNTIFEAIEHRRGAQGRGALARTVHAIGYEGGVLVVTIPMVAIMLGISLLEALVIEAGLLVFFLVFTVVYAWVFDRVFGLPASALASDAAR